ncbi:radical SAM protein [Streptomyces sp. BBFR2]|uniref:radical SAM protein n=1 Tax=Streptomyces sp. BBFR2 TaxID=3372854 RepID=UPI0037D9C4B5
MAPDNRVTLPTLKDGRSIVLEPDRLTFARVDSGLAERAAHYAHLGHGELPLSDQDRAVWAKVEQALEACAPLVPPDFGGTAVTKLIVGNTYHCNMGCTYCYNELDLKDRKGSEVPAGMTWETAKASIDALFAQTEAPALQMLFVGGEPLLEKEILRRSVAYARERSAVTGQRMSFAVYTNGTLMNRETIAWAGDEGVSLVVSLDGPPDLNDTHRIYLSGRPTSKAVLRNIRRLVDSGTQHILRVRAVSSPATPLVALHRYLLDLGFNEIHVQPMYDEHGIAAAEEEEMIKLLEWYRERLLEGTAIGVMPFEGFLGKLVLRGRGTGSWYPCSAGRNALAVGPTGTLYPCHHFLEEGSFEMGDVRQGLPIAEVRQPFFQRVDEREPCNSCWAKHVCGGECYHRAHAAGAGYTGTLPPTCRHRKSLIGLTLDVLADVAARRPDVLRAVVSQQYSRITPNDAAYAHTDLSPYRV